MADLQHKPQPSGCEPSVQRTFAFNFGDFLVPLGDGAPAARTGRRPQRQRITEGDRQKSLPGLGEEEQPMQPVRRPDVHRMCAVPLDDRTKLALSQLEVRGRDLAAKIYAGLHVNDRLLDRWKHLVKIDAFKFPREIDALEFARTAKKSGLAFVDASRIAAFCSLASLHHTLAVRGSFLFLDQSARLLWGYIAQPVKLRPLFRTMVLNRKPFLDAYRTVARGCEAEPRYLKLVTEEGIARELPEIDPVRCTPRRIRLKELFLAQARGALLKLDYSDHPKEKQLFHLCRCDLPSSRRAALLICDRAALADFIADRVSAREGDFRFGVSRLTSAMKNSPEAIAAATAAGVRLVCGITLPRTAAEFSRIYVWSPTSNVPMDDTRVTFLVAKETSDVGSYHARRHRNGGSISALP